jgi:hypothetical protein
LLRCAASIIIGGIIPKVFRSLQDVCESELARKVLEDAMPFKTACPKCERKLQVPDAALGKRVKCPGCAHVWALPAPLTAETVPEPPVKNTRFDEMMSDSLPSAGKPAATAASTAAARVRRPDGAVPSYCTHLGADIVMSFDAGDVTQRIKTKLAKKLGKKGVALYWTHETDSPEIVIRVLRIDQGNQLVRYLCPFIAPAVVEVEGRAAIGGAAPRRFRCVQKAQIGFFGGSARGMLNFCADRVGGKIAKEILKAAGR